MRQHNTNTILRSGIAKLGLRNWQAAEIVGLSESYFSRVIRKEMPQEQQFEMLQLIQHQCEQSTYGQSTYGREMTIEQIEEALGYKIKLVWTSGLKGI